MQEFLQKHKILLSFLALSFLMGMLGGIFVSSYVIQETLEQKIVSVLQKNTKEEKTSDVQKVVAAVEEQQTISVVQNVSPSVVSIIVEKDINNIYNSTGPDYLFPYDFFDNPFYDPYYPQQAPEPRVIPEQESIPEKRQQVGGGTGFIVKSDGLILTNKHVISDTDAHYTVILQDGRDFEATVIARDPLKDIGVLKIEGNQEEFPVVELGSSENIEIGQTVIAIGNSLSEYKNTVTKGVISGLGRRVQAGDNRGSLEIIEGAIQTDAAINPGNSGGPLLNLAGQVIGINTAINQSGQSIGFAIPIDDAKNVVTSIEKYGKIIRPFLGVRYIILNETIAKLNNLEVNHGALIVRGDSKEDLAVIPGSPADKAGLVENDIILEINGQQITEQQSLSYLISHFMPGDNITLKVYHDGNQQEVDVSLGELTSSENN